MKSQNIIKEIFKSIAFVATAVFLSYLMIVGSEYLGITRFDIGIPFLNDTPRVWANWLYPVYFFIGFSLAILLFRFSARYYIAAFFLMIALFILLYLATNGTLFENPRPFGESVYYPWAY